MIKEIAFTIYAVSDMAKSRAFYEGVLGLVPSDEFPVTPESLWIEYNIGAGTFALGRSDDWKPSEDGAVIAFEVDDFDATIATLKEADTTFKIEPMDFPTCHMAVVNDPDKNKVTIHKRKAK
jgi:predicted enzyme related to lactoylglutathione lyase